MRDSNLFWPVILIGTGVLLLLGNLGIFDRLEINVWQLVWPLALVALGIWFILGSFLRPSAGEAESAAIPLDGATQARVKLHHGAGRLTIGAGAAADQLAVGSFGGGLDYRARRDGDRLDVKMKMRETAWVTPFNWGPGRSLDWSLKLNDGVPLVLELETGASSTEVDLTDLRVTEFKLETGASSTSVTLPAHAGMTRVKIEFGAASVSVRVPGGVAARIRTKTGLASVAIDPARFPRSGDISSRRATMRRPTRSISTSKRVSGRWRSCDLAPGFRQQSDPNTKLHPVVRGQSGVFVPQETSRRPGGLSDDVWVLPSLRASAPRFPSEAAERPAQIPVRKPDASVFSAFAHL